MAKKNATTKKTPTKRTRRPAEKTPTADDLLRLKQKEQSAAAAYRDAVFSLDPNLSLAMRLRDQAAKLSLVVREIASPGPDSGGYLRAMCAAADVSRLLEFEARSVELSVLGREATS